MYSKQKAMNEVDAGRDQEEEEQEEGEKLFEWAYASTRAQQVGAFFFNQQG
jgi:hypothetical protein